MSGYIDNERVFPSAIRYSQITPLAVGGKALQKKFLPVSGGSYSNQNLICRINIASASEFLDTQNSYLKVVYTNMSATNVQIDNSAHSLINKIRITGRSGGSDLENTLQYHQLAAILSDLQLPANYRQSIHGYIGGYGNGGSVASLATSVAVGGALSTGGGFPLTNPLSNGLGEDWVAPNASRTYLISLVSMLGSLNQKYIPLFLTGDLQLEITFEPNSQFVSTANVAAAGADPAARNFSISTVEYIGHCVEFSGDVADKLRMAVMSEGLYLHLNQFRNFQMTTNGGSSVIQVQDRLKSVRSLLLGFNPVAAPTVGQRITHRQNALVTNFQCKVGQTFYPPQALTSTLVGGAADSSQTEMMASTMLAISEFNNVHCAPIITPQQWRFNGDSTDVVCGKAVYGVDFESFSKSNTMCGVDTIVNNPLTINVTTDGTARSANVFLCYDSYLAIKPDGTCAMLY